MKWWRKSHRIVALIALAPLLLITLTGILLQLRNQFEFIQPSLVREPFLNETSYLSFDEIIKKFPDEKIDKIIFNPNKNTLVVRLEGDEEVQLHPQKGKVLKRAIRRTGFLIHLHQGSFFGSFGQYFIYFLGSLGLLFLIISGLMLYPFKRKSI